MSTLDAAKVLQVYSCSIPPAGSWIADLALDSTLLPALAAATLTIGDLVLVGRCTQAGMDDHPTGGARPRVTVEGGAGWGTLLTRAGSYGPVAGGVRLSTVLRDLAALCGETYDPPKEALLPERYRWPASTPREPVTGRAVLADLMARGAIPTWRVDPATGKARFDAWPSLGAADASVRVMRRNLARGRRSLGLDTRVHAVLPGATIEGVVIRRLRLHEDARKLGAEVYSL